jgi:hypothetical protein
MADSFSAEQRRLVAQALREGSRLECPICREALDRSPVPPRGDVAYVRDRILLTCPSCRRSLVLDRRDP